MQNGRRKSQSTPCPAQRPAASQVSARQATATLELVLALPVLLSVIVGIVWLGVSVVGQTEVTIEARYAAWQKREGSPSTALLFLKDDIVSAESSTTVDVSPVFKDVDSPESSHDVMANSWDHSSLTLNDSPNWEAFALAALNAKSGSLQTGYVDARNQFGRFQSEAANAWRTFGLELMNQLTGLGNQAGSGMEGGRGSKADEAVELARIDRALAAKRRELRKAQKQLRELDGDESKAFKDVLNNKVKRLRADVADLEADRKALN